jgi:hypothetical protein
MLKPREVVTRPQPRPVAAYTSNPNQCLITKPIRDLRAIRGQTK